MKLHCPRGHEVKVPFQPSHADLICPEHNVPLKTGMQAKPRKPLRRVSEKREAQVRHQGSTLKRGRGFAASRVQRNKVRDMSCVCCGLDRYEATIDPAHLWDRGRGGCDHILCVVALCRRCHDLYDNHGLDLLPRLLACGLYEEIAHPIRAHGVSLTTLLERVTNRRWVPVEQESPMRGAVA